VSRGQNQRLKSPLKWLSKSNQQNLFQFRKDLSKPGLKPGDKFSLKTEGFTTQSRATSFHQKYKELYRTTKMTKSIFVLNTI